MSNEMGHRGHAVSVECYLPDIAPVQAVGCTRDHPGSSLQVGVQPHMSVGFQESLPSGPEMVATRGAVSQCSTCAGECDHLRRYDEFPGSQPARIRPLARHEAPILARVSAAPTARNGYPPGRSPSRTGRIRSPRLCRPPEPRRLEVGPTWHRGFVRDN